ncbi:hypothetical protein LINPERHAP2_LOCUS32278 [Linum perenne]
MAIPYEEGGLDLPNLSLWNSACVARHLWAIIMHGESLWIAWIHTYRIQRRDIWSCDASSNASWVWKRILKAREKIFPHFTFDLDGALLWDGQPTQKFKASLKILTMCLVAVITVEQCYCSCLRSSSPRLMLSAPLGVI